MRIIKLFLCVIFYCGIVVSCPAWAVQEAQEVQEAGIKAEVLEKASASWDGQALPVYPEGAPEITILRITIPAGAELPLHSHPYINAGVLISGELTVRTETGKTIRLSAGDALIEVVDTWHYGANEGTEPAEIIVFYAGIAGEPITVKAQ